MRLPSFLWLRERARTHAQRRPYSPLREGTNYKGLLTPSLSSFFNKYKNEIINFLTFVFPSLNSPRKITDFTRLMLTIKLQIMYTNTICVYVYINIYITSIPYLLMFMVFAKIKINPLLCNLYYNFLYLISNYFVKHVYNLEKIIH